VAKSGFYAGSASLSDNDLIAVKEKLKSEFLEWLWRRALLWPHWAKKMRAHPVALWTRRITSYKRLDILERIFHDPVRRKAFLGHGVVLVVGGRIYQRDNVSEKMVYGLVEFLNRDEELGERVIFLHNYNVWEAPALVLRSRRIGDVVGRWPGSVGHGVHESPDERRRRYREPRRSRA
jgi:glucan phosphorylase